MGANHERRLGAALWNRVIYALVAECLGYMSWSWMYWMIGESTVAQFNDKK
jgi:hypothetical protein